MGHGVSNSNRQQLKQDPHTPPYPTKSNVQYRRTKEHKDRSFNDQSEDGGRVIKGASISRAKLAKACTRV